MEGICFGYRSDQQVLTSVDLTIKPGERIAVVGPSGSGKSTLLQLLLRLYDPQAGRILVDGEDLRQFTLASYSAQVAVVFQDTFLFAGTVRENIALGELGATDDKIFAAARAAEIHDVILGLRDGYDTQVGELGGLLSGGQRQRIAIARAILRDPALLIFDEATSALDSSTEAAINTTLETLAVGRRVVTVTHRLALARSADRIVVLAQGRVVEVGTHADLLSRNGMYRSLWDNQRGIEAGPDALNEASC